MGGALSLTGRRIALALVAIAGVVACGGLIFLATGDSESASSAAAPQVAQAAERTPTDSIRYASASPAQVAAAREATTAMAAAMRKEQRADIDPGPGGILPASAGENGTFDEPRNRGRHLDALTMSGANGLPPERSAYLIGRTAIAPAGAPDEVERAISAANAIVGRPYIWGGGHSSWIDRGYDCSGAVSYTLGGAGLLGAPVNSSALMDWGEPGRGKWITVYANPSHTYAVIAGLRWDTVGEQRGTGPKWHAELPYPDGYVARHPPGL